MNNQTSTLNDINLDAAVGGVGCYATTEPGGSGMYPQSVCDAPAVLDWMRDTIGMVRNGGKYK
jgi:hypothetical protein